MLRLMTMLMLVAAVAGSSLVAGHAQYHLVSEKLSWKDADQACRTLNRSLMKINSIKELRAIQTLLASEPSQTVWLGMDEKNTQGHFLANSDEVLTDYPTEELGDCITLHPFHGVHLTPCSEQTLGAICGAKTNLPNYTVTNSLANLKSSVRRVVRSVECVTAKPKRKSGRRRKQFRKSRRRRIHRKKVALDGRMSGNITGSMDGLISGISRGSTTGIAHGILHGTLTGIFEGNATGEVIGFMRGTFEGEEVDRWTDGYEMGDFNGRLVGEIEGVAYGLCIGDVVGNIVGNTTGTLEGSLVGTLVGNMRGRLTGRQEEGDLNDEDLKGFFGPNVDIIGNEPVHANGNPSHTSTYILVDDNTRKISGELWGELNGDMRGNVDGVLEGRYIEGAMEGMMNGTLTGNLTGTLSGVATGNLTHLGTGEEKHVEDYLLSDGEELNLVGRFVGEATGSLVGSVVGEVTGHLKGQLKGTVFGVLNGELEGTMAGFVDGEVVLATAEEETNDV